MASITSANAVLMLTIPPLFDVPQRIQGFATDDIYNIPNIRSVEAMMGVDGILSGGFVYTMVPQEIVLRADSRSNSIFDTWWTQMNAARDTYIASGLITLPSVLTKFQQTTGFLTGYSPSPGAGRTLKDRRYEITWQTIIPAPI